MNIIKVGSQVYNLDYGYAFVRSLVDFDHVIIQLPNKETYIVQVKDLQLVPQG